MPNPEAYTQETVVSVAGTGNVFATNELPVDMHSKNLSAMASVTVMTSLLQRLSKDPAYNFRVDWQEQNEIPTKITIGAISSAATTLPVVANGKTLVLDTIIFNPDTMESYKIGSAPTSDTSVTISRAAAGSTAAAATAGTVCYVLPPAVAENDANYRASSVADSNVYNYLQLIRMNYSITRIGSQMKTHFGTSKREALRTQKYTELRKKRELMLYFGGRSAGGTAPASVWTAGGLVHYLYNGTLYKDFGGIFTETGFDNMLGDYHDQNPDSTRIGVFAAPNVLRQVSYWAKDKIQMSTNAKQYGLNIKTYTGGGVDVDLFPLPLLTDPVCRGWGFVLDLERIRQKVLDPVTWYGDALGVGQSEIIYDLYRSVDSYLIGTESRHMMFVGAKL